MELHGRVETESAAGKISCRLGNSILNQPVIDPRVIIRVNELRPLREHDGIWQINRNDSIQLTEDIDIFSTGIHFSGFTEVIRTGI